MRPERCTYILESSGTSKWITDATPATWMPRAATSLATSAWTLPLEKSASARVRWFWLRPPWIVAT